MSNTKLVGTKPLSVWKKPVAIDAKPLATALAKAAVEVITGRWDEAAKGVTDGLNALGLATRPEELAWTLVYKALLRASFDLLKESAPQLTLPKKGIERVSTRIESQLAFHGFELDATFFERPGEIPLLEEFKKPLGLLLEDFGIHPKSARALVDRLPSYFTFALVTEWRSHPQEYDALRVVLDTPFAKAAERETSWKQYAAWLARQIDEPVFDELFGLRQIYIPLRGYYTVKATPSGKEVDPRDFEREPRRVVVDLSAEIEAWLNRADPQDSIRVLSGGPGSGKSSFAKMLAAKLAETGVRKVLFIPLHRFELTDDLVDAVGQYLRFDQHLTHNPLDPKTGDANVFVIFDGLDELAMQGKLAAEVAQKFVREVERKVALLNSGSAARLQALIVGRELTIQAQAGDFRREGQILHALPYFVSHEQQKNMQWIDHEGRLKSDQRHMWWKAYGELTNRTFKKLPQALRRPELDEVTAQPLLNYLVALSYVRKKTSFVENFNLNAMYGDLLHAVYERGWAGGKHVAVRDIDYQGFVRVLEEIALATWHGDGRTTTVREIEEHCTASGLAQLLDIFQEGAKTGVTRLLTAFYFRQRGEQLGGDKTFEFTHKSFGEYLTALRLIRLLEKTAMMLQRRRESVDDGWDERSALAEWIPMTGPTPPDQYLVAFMWREVQLYATEKVVRWQADLDLLIGSAIAHGIPMERIAGPTLFAEQMDWARNVGMALMVLRSSCARVTQVRSSIRFDSPTAFGIWLTWVASQFGSADRAVLASLNHLDLSNATLYFREFFEADLSFTSLAGARLDFVTFARANLQGADLSDLHSTNVNFDSANLMDAKITRSVFMLSTFRQAYMQRVNGREAHFDGCNFQYARCANADFSEAQWYDVNFAHTDFSGALMDDALVDMKPFTGAWAGRTSAGE